jgi:hypothetical protein
MQFKKYLFSLIALISFIDSFGQNASKKSKTSLLITAGTATYFGDLTTDLHSLTFNPNLGLGLSYNLTRLFGARAELNYFRLGAIKSDMSGDISFSSNNFEFSGVVLYDLQSHIKPASKRNKVSSYIFAGFGITSFHSKVEKSGNFISYDSLSESKHSGYTPVIPFGAGVKIKLGSKTDLILELGYRKTFTDYLDNVSPHYIATDGNAITYPPADVQKSKNDSYIFTTFKILYTPKNFLQKKLKTATTLSRTQIKKSKDSSIKISKSKKLSSNKKSRMDSTIF